MKLQNKLKTRQGKRKLKIRSKFKATTIQHRVIVNRTNKHFYAQLFDKESSKVAFGIASSSKTFKPSAGSNSIVSCVELAKQFAAKLKEKNISQVVFDRSGLKYHGKIKAFADALREEGIKL